MSIINDALEYAYAGWEIIPCNPHPGARAKAPLIPGGFKNASSNPELIKHWFRKHPKALIGLAIPPGLTVIDIDPRNGGTIDKALTALDIETLPPTLTVITGRKDGGKHFYYHTPTPLTYTPTPGIDIKTGGTGYCIAPPSPHPNTQHPYTWADPDTPIATLTTTPHTVRERARLNTLAIPETYQPCSNTPTPARIKGALNALATAEKGNRNNTLYWVTSLIRDLGATDYLGLTIETALQAGLTPREIKNTIKSALKPTSKGI